MEPRSTLVVPSHHQPNCHSTGEHSCYPQSNQTCQSTSIKRYSEEYRHLPSTFICLVKLMPTCHDWSTWTTPLTGIDHWTSRSNTDLNRFPFNNFTHYLTPFSRCFSSFPHGTCSLSVSCHYLALDEIYHPFWAAFPNNSTLWERLI